MWGKGLDVLVDAWGQIMSSRPARPLRLVMVGGGRDRDAIHSLIETRGLASSIEWLDEYVLNPNVVRMYLSAADVYAFPSRHEGFAVAPMEAMACGLPVVASNASGISDLLADGERSGGVIVPLGDVPALARELGALLDDPGRSRWLGERARARVERAVSIETIGRQLRAFLERDGALPTRR
jgi:starch synthase